MVAELEVERVRIAEREQTFRDEIAAREREVERRIEILEGREGELRYSDSLLLQRENVLGAREAELDNLAQELEARSDERLKAREAELDQRERQIEIAELHTAEEKRRFESRAIHVTELERRSHLREASVEEREAELTEARKELEQRSAELAEREEIVESPQARVRRLRAPRPGLVLLGPLRRPAPHERGQVCSAPWRP